MKETTFGSALRKLREREKLSIKQVIEELKKYGQNITDKTLYSYENDTRAVSADMLLALCQIYNCSNILETFAGIEPDYSIPDDTEWKMIEKYRYISEHFQNGADTINHVLNREYKLAEQMAMLRGHSTTVIDFDGQQNVPTRYIQYYQKVSAGTGELIYEDTPPEQIAIPDIPKFRRVAYAVKVSGHSMETTYYDGDLLLIEPACIVDIGENGIFNVGGKAFVKKRGETELISLNEGYENVPLTNEARCMGRVVDRYVAD